MQERDEYAALLGAQKQDLDQTEQTGQIGQVAPTVLEETKETGLIGHTRQRELLEAIENRDNPLSLNRWRGFKLHLPTIRFKRALILAAGVGAIAIASLTAIHGPKNQEIIPDNPQPIRISASTDVMGAEEAVRGAMAYNIVNTPEIKIVIDEAIGGQINGQVNLDDSLEREQIIAGSHGGLEEIEKLVNITRDSGGNINEEVKNISFLVRLSQAAAAPAAEIAQREQQNNTRFSRFSLVPI